MLSPPATCGSLWLCSWDLGDRRRGPLWLWEEKGDGLAQGGLGPDPDSPHRPDDREDMGGRCLGAQAPSHHENVGLQPSA